MLEPFWDVTNKVKRWVAIVAETCDKVRGKSEDDERNPVTSDSQVVNDTTPLPPSLLGEFEGSEDEDADETDNGILLCFANVCKDVADNEVRGLIVCIDTRDSKKSRDLTNNDGDGGSRSETGDNSGRDKIDNETETEEANEEEVNSRHEGESDCKSDGIIDLVSTGIEVEGCDGLGGEEGKHGSGANRDIL